MARRSLRRKRTRNKRRRSNMKTRRSVHSGRRSRRRRQRRGQRRRTLRGGGFFNMFKSKETRERDARLKADADSHKPSQGQASIAKLHAHDAKVKEAGGHAELAKAELEAERREAFGADSVVDWNVEDVEAGVKPEAVRTATSSSILRQSGKDEWGQGHTAAAPAPRTGP